jgi:hypothetical protein
MFLGNHKPKRAINLGNTTSYSAKELLERNKRAREERSRNERVAKASQVLHRWISSLLIRKREFQILSKTIESERLLQLYSVFFPFVTVKEWISVLKTGCHPSPSLLSRLCRIVDRSNELGILLWRIMRKENVADFEFLRSCILNYPDQRNDILDFATNSCHQNVNNFIVFILVLPGVQPPASILRQVFETIQSGTLSIEDQRTLFLNSLRVSPPFLPLLLWGLEHIDVYSVYHTETIDEDEQMLDDILSSPDRDLVDQIGTTDSFRRILALDSSWYNIVSVLGLVLFRYYFLIQICE